LDVAQLRGGSAERKFLGHSPERLYLPELHKASST
jgi:hypothetical protein